MYLVIICGMTSLNAQEKDQQDQIMPLDKAISIAQNAYSKTLLEKAATDLKTYAEQGEVSAMHTLGMLYYQGLGIRKDIPASKGWFEKAAKKGYAKSFYNLAMMYRRGIGTSQDFDKAYKYLTIAAVEKEPQMIYALGYFKYKGLGCDQNYGEAIKCFLEAAQSEHGYAMYMLGLCYRNGYGTDIDHAQAMYWLRKAANKNVKLSSKELEIEAPERPLQPQMLKNFGIQEQENVTVVPITYKSVIHETLPIDNISGVYEGTLVTYDWSGKHILTENSLILNINQWGDDFKAEWQEEGKESMEISGLLSDSILLFTNAKYLKKERYEEENIKEENIEEWNFVKAKLSVLEEDGYKLLTGNLQMISSIEKEPGKPMYLVLKKKNDKEKENNTQKVPLVIYPNPFEDLINISFSLEKNAKCKILVYNAYGFNIYQQNLGVLTKGKHLYQVNLNVSQGRYIVKLSYDDKIESSIIIRK